MAGEPVFFVFGLLKAVVAGLSWFDLQEDTKRLNSER
jgi:hypothetical protein